MRSQVKGPPGSLHKGAGVFPFLIFPFPLPLDPTTHSHSPTSKNPATCRLPHRPTQRTTARLMPTQSAAWTWFGDMLPTWAARLSLTGRATLGARFSRLWQGTRRCLRSMRMAMCLIRMKRRMSLSICMRIWRLERRWLCALCRRGFGLEWGLVMVTY